MHNAYCAVCIVHIYVLFPFRFQMHRKWKCSRVHLSLIFNFSFGLTGKKVRTPFHEYCCSPQTVTSLELLEKMVDCFFWTNEKKNAELVLGKLFSSVCLQNYAVYLNPLKAFLMLSHNGAFVYITPFGNITRKARMVKSFNASMHLILKTNFFILFSNFQCFFVFYDDGIFTFPCIEFLSIF